jgi:DNA polymerase III psi subunit
MAQARPPAVWMSGARVDLEQEYAELNESPNGRTLQSEKHPEIALWNEIQLTAIATASLELLNKWI